MKLPGPNPNISTRNRKRIWSTPIAPLMKCQTETTCTILWITLAGQWNLIREITWPHTPTFLPATGKGFGPPQSPRLDEMSN